MESIKILIKKNKVILALGAESAGVFAVYNNGNLFISENFGDLLDKNNFLKYKKAILSYLKKEIVKSDVILTDLHPLFKTTVFGEELAKKYKIPHIKVQHHIAHIFSAVGDRIINAKQADLINNNLAFRIQSSAFYGIAMDGTGYGLDGKVWGGEVFRIQIPNPKTQIPIKSQNTNSKILRIGSLEEQIMIGGDAAVKEPARMLITILTKIPNPKLQIPIKTQIPNLNVQKEFIFSFVKKFYTRNEFEALYNQMDQNFNCLKTTSTGRILDAVSVLLGFSGNERNFKHEAIKKMEENSSVPYDDLNPQITNHNSRKILGTTFLFKYLIKNIQKDKKRLAATAQLYIAKGLYEIIKKKHKSFIVNRKSCIFAAGGLSNNKIISEYLESRGVYLSKKISRGDEGIAVGQIVYYLLNEK